ncbi:MAG: patatin-like phospholipase family protein [Candidatus Sulfotelmatobacter sp.]|jgi:NTE family protein
MFSSHARSVPIALIFLAAVFCPTNSHAQQELAPTTPTETTTETPAVPPHRPLIGVALAGGGALGLAHIGVLQWMEENHIPVDKLAGTSMGALVGAFFATGRNGAEMRQFVKTIRWDEALLAEPTYGQLSYRRKQDRRDYQFGGELGLKHGFNGPNGFDPGHGVGLVLDRMSFAYSTISSFDDLPTPFRCVATDLLTGQAVVLHDGSLAQALRASMAIPGVFTPQELNGRVLADGGLVDNLPTDVVRQMNVDVVIAVDIVTQPPTKTQFESVTGILTRAVDVMMLDNERRALQLADVVVSLDLGKLGAFDYDKSETIINLGYKAAAARAAALRPFALSDADWQTYVADREARKRSPEKSADILEVTGVSGDEQQHLEKRLQKALRKDLQPNLNIDKLDARLTQIVGEGRFDRMGYEGFVQNGVPGLRVVAHEKSYGPPFVDLAVNVDGSGVAAFDVSGGARVTFMDVGHHGGEWRNDLLFGSSNLAATEFYQPLALSRFFVAPFAFASKFARNSFTGETRVAVFGDERAGGGFDFGYDSGRRSEIRLGYEIFSGKLDPLIGSAGLPIVSGNTGEFRLRYVWDGQDSPTVPSRGLRIVSSLSRVLQSPDLAHPITQLDVQTSTFAPLSAKTSLFFIASAGTSFHGTAGPFQVFALGGPFHLGAYLPQEFLGNHYGYSSLGFRREFYRLPQLVGGKIYWAGWYEAGTAFNDPDSVVVRGTFNLGVIAETIAGPLALAGSISPTGQSRINFSIGRLF